MDLNIAQIHFSGCSDIGRVRSANQDNFYTGRLCKNSVLCVVCDGMGGARGGNVASTLAAEVFSERVTKLAAQKTDDGILELTPDSACDLLDDAVRAANNAVFKKSLSSKEYSGMGTTLVAVLFCGDVAYVVNVGDSRLYLLSGGELTQITHDHSYVQHLIDSGSLTVEEARNHPFRNRITRAVGIGGSLETDIFSIELAGIDSCHLLLCTDGLHGMLTPDQLHDLILGIEPEIENSDKAESESVSEDESASTEHTEAEKPFFPDSDPDGVLEARVARLIEAANDAGGQDNITAVLISYDAE